MSPKEVAKRVGASLNLSSLLTTHNQNGGWLYTSNFTLSTWPLQPNSAHLELC